MDLAHFVEASLVRRGCLTQSLGEDRLDALLPADAAAALDLPEDARLRLCGATASGEEHAGYGSGVLGKICALNEMLPCAYHLELAPALPKRERLEREVESVLAFQDGIARLEAIEESLLEYVVVDFRYVVLSEDRQEGLVRVALDLAGGASSPGLAEGLPAWLAEHPEARRPWSGWQDWPEFEPQLRRARQLALARARCETEAFAARMARRLQRDSRRVEVYYRALRDEVEHRRHRERRDSQALQRKIDAIEAESLRRRHDLQHRYAIRLRLEPLALLVVRISGLAAGIRLQRRKTSTRARLGWNGIAREFDRWTCDACGAEARVPALCDALHRLCGSCASDCPPCRRSEA